MPAKNSQPVTKIKFNAIAKALKQTPGDIEAIASAHGVKASTVKNIRRAGAWEEYERRKASFAAKRAMSNSARRALNPAPRPVAKKAVVTSKAKRAIVVKEEPVSEFVTKEQLNEQIFATLKIASEKLNNRTKPMESLLAQCTAHVKELDDSVLALQQAESVRLIRERRAPWWKRIFGKVGR